MNKQLQDASCFHFFPLLLSNTGLWHTGNLQYQSPNPCNLPTFINQDLQTSGVAKNVGDTNCFKTAWWRTICDRWCGGLSPTLNSCFNRHFAVTSRYQHSQSFPNGTRRYCMFVYHNEYIQHVTIKTLYSDCILLCII